MPHSGMRPEEIYTLSWQHVDVSTERVIHIPGGKTKNAKRTLALTPKVYDMLMTCYQREGAPREVWVFPAPTQSSHINESSIKHQHKAAIQAAGLAYFELYCLRHTFLTILGDSGCDPDTLCRIAGHADIQMTMRYCHTTKEFMHQAFKRFVEFRQKGVTTGGYRTNEQPADVSAAPAILSNKRP